MGKNLNDFIKSNPNIDNETKEKAEDTARDLLNKYGGMNQSELMQQFMSEVSKQKQNGTFDKQKLLTMVNSIKDLIPTEKYNQIMLILESL